MAIKKSKEGKAVQKTVTKMIKKLIKGIDYRGEVKYLNQLADCKAYAMLGDLRLVRIGSTKFVKMEEGQSFPPNEVYVKDGRKYVPIQRKEGDTGDVKTSSLITTYHKTKEENIVYMWNGSKFIRICKA